MNGRTAIVLGATGLTGKQLVRLLLADKRFSSVKTFVRKPSGINDNKLAEHVIDFEKPAQWSDLVRGDVLFSALGTTLKVAGSKEAQYRVDHTYQYQFAKAASENGVPVYVLVSAAMASARARLFYPKMKGELERDIRELPFRNIHIMQPGMLAGDRQEYRAGEKIGIKVLKFLNGLGILKSQKPIDVAILAKAMINVSFSNDQPVNTYVLDEIFPLAD